MTSSKLRTKVYEAVREKTIYPLVTSRRQQSMEESISHDQTKIPVVTYHRDEEKENACAAQGGTRAEVGEVMCAVQGDIGADSTGSEMVRDLNSEVVMGESEEPVQNTVSSTLHAEFPTSTPVQYHSPVTKTIQAPAAASTPDIPNTSFSPSRTFKIHDNTFEKMRAQEPSPGALHSSPRLACTSTEVPPQTTPIVRNKRGRPKGSTTKNRKVKGMKGGLNMFGGNNSKFSTLELLSLAAQQQVNARFILTILLIISEIIQVLEDLVNIN